MGGDYWSLGGGNANGSVYDYGCPGLCFPGGHVQITNSTITGNLAYSHGDDDGDSRGGGISTDAGGSLTIRHSTIARNHSVGVSSEVTSFGGGISNKGLGGGSVLNMLNTIVANNDAVDGGQDFHGVLSQSGYNIFGIIDDGSGFNPSDILDIDPMLGPLADNGGPTLTMALLPGSPAIDAGDPNIIDPPDWDQRGPGFPRIVNGTVDIGAFEVQATGAPLVGDFVALLITADLGNENIKRRG